ncbi:MAG: c-type cytochrome, partial [Nitriliruptorales bacterium]|nr:c-type cytochrome [Nitriliruptorales bacterium]
DIDEGMLNDPQLIDQGADIFGRDCALCHGEAGRGISREQAPQAYGPSLVGVGPASVDFMLRTGRMPLDNSNARLRHSEQHVSDEERRALVAYVASLGEEGEGMAIPDVTGYEDADLGVGLDLFTSNCAACHGPTGAGIAVGQEDVSSTLDISTPLEVAEAIRTGPGVMPVFGEDVLSQEELEAVVHWVVDLRSRPAPGGAQVGRSGPVWEGLVAWTLGLGSLMVVMYLLGEKATGDEDDEPNA